MDPGPLRDALTLLLGFATGLLSGMFGVGGAVISTPGIRALGADAVVAIGTTLPSIFPGAVSGSLRYGREGLIEWRAVAATVPLGLVMAVVGALLVEVIPGEGHLLMVATAGLLLFSASRLARPVQDTPLAGGEVAPPPPGHQTARFVAVGAAAGLTSGLLGIGGGVVMVPGFVELAGLSVKRAIATSLVCVGLFGIPGTITHALLGNIDWRFALLLTVGVIPGAWIGAHLTIRAADSRVRRTVAAFLGLTAVVYGAGEILSLVR
jgi:uncharacterized membrane protein YfcA